MLFSHYNYTSLCVEQKHNFISNEFFLSLMNFQNVCIVPTMFKT